MGLISANLTQFLPFGFGKPAPFGIGGSEPAGPGGTAPVGIGATPGASPFWALTAAKRAAITAACFMVVGISSNSFEMVFAYALDLNSVLQVIRGRLLVL